MDDPYPVSVRGDATWQSDAERQTERGPPRWRRPLGIALAGVVGLAVIGAAVLWWLHARQFETTDDAFVDGYVTQVAPQVAGRVTALKFADNEHVTAGQTLLPIDPRDYQVKLDQAKAQRSNAAARLQQAEAQLGVQQANLDQAQANVRSRKPTSSQAQTGLRPLHLDQSACRVAPAGRQCHRHVPLGTGQAGRRPAGGAWRGGTAAGRAGAGGGRSGAVQQADANVAAARAAAFLLHDRAPVSGRSPSQRRCRQLCQSGSGRCSPSCRTSLG